MENNKVIVIGCPGSGKSTFARKLQKIMGLPIYYLDRLYWNEDKTTVSKDIFRKRLADTLNESRWIIDGNYNSTIELRIKSCDIVYFLDYPVETCINGIKERLGKPREDMPWIEMEEDVEFIDFIRNYSVTARPKILELLETHSDKNIVVFHSREEAEEYLKKII